MAATYKGLLTNNGKALIASATTSNKINYSHIAVGDGNGSVPTPLETRTALVNEKARIALNVVEINPNNTNQIVCEAIIPTTTGGFYIRELGLYAGSTMVVNASYPPTYKPLEDEGGVREIAIKLVINIQNAEVIALYLDNSLIYATREWVDTNYVRRDAIVDNLTTDDAAKPLSAKQGKNLQDNKLDKTANAASAAKLQTARKIQGVDFDGTKDIYLPNATTLQKGITQLVNDLTTGGTDKALTAEQGKNLQDNKLDKTANAVSATKLATARTIGGVSFDGTANINLPGVNTAGNQNTTGNAATATKLATAITIGGVSFDGTANINLPGVNTAGNQNTTGNAATATKLATARTINGVSFDGSGNITITDDTKALLTDFINSKAQNGYQKLPNGIIIQWGYMAAAGIAMNVTFPIAFPNACFFASAQIKHTTYNYQSISINTPSKTGFPLYWDNAGQGIFWFAIGH